MVDATLSGLALAQAAPPAGYSTSFVDGLASIQGAGTYYGNNELSSYNITQCAEICNQNSNCNAFNIYFQRNPVYTPMNNCTNPPAVAQIQCVLWGNYVDTSQLTNVGQWRESFAVVLSGSNGYNKNVLPATVANYHGPYAQTGTPGYSIGAYTAYQWLGTYDATICAASCLGLNQARYNSAAYRWFGYTGSYTPCNQFNIMNLTVAGVTEYYLCLYYSNYADMYNPSLTQLNIGGELDVSYSYTYDLYPPDKGLVSSPWQAAPAGTAASCTALQSQYGNSLTDIFNSVNWNFYCGYDILGSYDIARAYGTDFYNCMYICENTANCNAFTFGWNTCYMKQVNSTSFNAPTAGSNSQLAIAWMANSGYAGFSAGNDTNPKVAGPTTTITYTGAVKTTITRAAGTAAASASVVVEVPGVVPAYTTSGGVTYYTAATDSGTASTIQTLTVAGANAKTSTILTVYPTPVTTCGNAGANYMLYPNNFSASATTSSYAAYTPEAFKTAPPLATGTSTYIAEDNSGSAAVSVYGNSVVATGLTIQNTFYIFAGRGSGFYSIQVPNTNGIEFVWAGQKAVNGWVRANADIATFSAGSGFISYWLPMGAYLPVRVQWGNDGGAGSMELNVWAPDGSPLIQYLGSNTGSMSPDIVTFPCNSTLGSAFPVWNPTTGVYMGF